MRTEENRKPFPRPARLAVLALAFCLTWTAAAQELPSMADKGVKACTAEIGVPYSWDELRQVQSKAIVTDEMSDPAPHPIRLRTREYKPEPGIDPSLYRAEGDAVYAVAQRRSFPEDEDFAAWSDHDVEIVSYLGDLAWVVRLRLDGRPVDEVLGEAYEVLGAKALAAIADGDKIDPGLTSGETEDWFFDPVTGLITVDLSFYLGTGGEHVEAVVDRYHRGIDPPEPVTDLLWTLQIAAESLAEIAADRDVRFIERGARTVFPTMDTARDLVHADGPQGIDIVPLPPTYQLAGDGVRLSNGEGIGGGVHQDFWNHDSLGAPTTGRWAPGAAIFGGDHGVMTGAIMLGNGWLSQTEGGTPYQWRGIAPEAIFDGYENEPDVSNHSFAQAPWGMYSSVNAGTDRKIRGDAPTNFHPHVGAVANQGLSIQYGTERGYYSVYRNSKNEMIVANLQSYDGFWARSSLGPTFDGRIKPDVGAPGLRGIFPREDGLDFDVDEIELVSVNGNRLWTFDAAASTWYGGWGDPAQAWWTKLNIGPISQAAYGPITAMRFEVLAPPWGGGWANRPMVGTLAEPDAVTPLVHAGDAGDVLRVRYRFEADAMWDGAKMDARWMKDFPVYTSQASLGVSILADGNWHDAFIPVGTSSDWAGQPSIRYLSLRWGGKPMLRAANPDKYSGSGGSSAAAPVVAGSMALLLEKLADDFGMALGDPSPSPFWQPSPGNGVVLPSTLKALLVHTARDLEWTPGEDPDPPNPDTGAETKYGKGPDYVTGYGVIDVEKAVAVLDDEAVLGAGNRILEDEIGASGGDVYSVIVPFGWNQPLKVTLAWDDYPGDHTAAEVVPKLVNNLDLVLKDPAGNFHFPWSIDLPYVPTSPSQYPSAVEPEPITAADIHPARRDLPNHRDNVEQVSIDCAVHGHWQVYVLASGMGAPPQRYSLVLDKP